MALWNRSLMGYLARQSVALQVRGELRQQRKGNTLSRQVDLLILKIFRIAKDPESFQMGHRVGVMREAAKRLLELEAENAALKEKVHYLKKAAHKKHL